MPSRQNIKDFIFGFQRDARKNVYAKKYSNIPQQPYQTSDPDIINRAIKKVSGILGGGHDEERNAYQYGFLKKAPEGMTDWGPPKAEPVEEALDSRRKKVTKIIYAKGAKEKLK